MSAFFKLPGIYILSAENSYGYKNKFFSFNILQIFLIVLLTVIFHLPLRVIKSIKVCYRTGKGSFCVDKTTHL